MSSQAVVMGIDAGFASCGVVVARGRTIVDACVIRTKNVSGKRGIRVADMDAERCAALARGLRDVLAMHHPTGIAVELPTGGARGARSNRAMGMATAVVVTVLELGGYAAEWVTPQAVKKASAGNSNSSKDDVAKGVLEAFDWCCLGTCKVPKTQLEHVFDAAGCLLAAEHGTLMRAVGWRRQGGSSNGVINAIKKITPD
jgi:Holliday junction resolvasome RuvABC endonuclease subunit